LTLLVARERDTKIVLSAPLPTKGTTGKFAVKRFMAFLKEIGCEGQQTILKSDQEQAIKAVIDQVVRSRGDARTIVEQSPVKSHGSNGIVERAIQSVVKQLKVLKSALEARWGAEIPDNHSIMVWMTEYAGFLLNRFEVSRDGKTSYERLKGKKSKTSGLEFGEGILFKQKNLKGQLGKLDLTWLDGIYLGVKGLSGEIIVGTETGAWRTRTVRRKPEQERWKTENSKTIGGIP